MNNPDNLFSADFFSANRAAIRKGREGLIVVSAHAELQESADSAFRFRQDSNFWYLTGSDYPELILVIDIDQKREFIILPKGQNPTYDTFNGALDLEDLVATSGVPLVLPWAEGWALLKQLARPKKNVWLPLPADRYQSTYRMYVNPSRRRLQERLKALEKTLVFEDLRPVLAAKRQIKQPKELAAIQRAIDITGLAFKELRLALPELKYEYQAQALLEFVFRDNGASGPAYGSIVASDANGVILHYAANAERIKKDSFLLIDAAARYDHYAADITRTLSVGTVSARHRAVLKAVARVQKQAISMVRHGIDRVEYEEGVEKLIGKELVGLGLISSLSRSAIRKYYPHATGHFLGLDTHDAGNYDQMFTTGTVLTVEPGIYIPEEGIGVRLEDDVLVTKTGCDVLSEHIPSYV